MFAKLFLDLQRGSSKPQRLLSPRNLLREPQVHQLLHGPGVNVIKLIFIFVVGSHAK
jgi:hypothetical protein